MTERQIILLKDWWDRVKPKSDQLAEIFYYYLFEKNPQYRVLFKGSFYEQQQKFVNMLDMILIHVERLHLMEKELKASGRRHEAYGVKNEDYSVVGTAFLHALQTALGDEWTAEHAEAWSKAYEAISNYMFESYS